MKSFTLVGNGWSRTLDFELIRLYQEHWQKEVHASFDIKANDVVYDDRYFDMDLIVVDQDDKTIYSFSDEFNAYQELGWLSTYHERVPSERPNEYDQYLKHLALGEALDRQYGLVY